MNTCVLCLRRRNALECTIRSRSRWNGVGWSESGSGTSRSAGYERVASGESCSSRRSTRSRKLERAKAWAIRWRAYLVLPRNFLRKRPEACRAVVEVVEQETPRELGPAAGLEGVVGHLVAQRHALLARPRGHLLEPVDRVPALAHRRRPPLPARRRLEVGVGAQRAVRRRGRGRRPVGTAAPRHEDGGAEDDGPPHSRSRKGAQLSVVPLRTQKSDRGAVSRGVIRAPVPSGTDAVAAVPCCDLDGRGGVLNQA